MKGKVGWEDRWQGETLQTPCYLVDSMKIDESSE